MMEMIYQFLLLTINYDFVNGESSRYLEAVQNSLFKDISIEKNPVLNMSTRSVIGCIRRCIATDQCMSFAFRNSTNECRVFDASYLNPSLVSDKISENGWRYYNLKQDNSNLTCPDGYVNRSHIDFCYKLYPSGMVYADAVALCQGDGAYLAKIDTKAKQDEIETYLASQGGVTVRIQGQRNESTNLWSYDDGTPMTYFNWNSAGGQPELRASEIVIMARHTKGYRWHDGFTHETFAFLCEFPLS